MTQWQTGKYALSKPMMTNFYEMIVVMSKRVDTQQSAVSFHAATSPFLKKKIRGAKTY